MIFRRFHDPKLAQSSYLIGCGASREALVVDPNRAVDQYLHAAKDEGLRITHVTETHIHADFVSGARELAHEAGARLYLSGAGGAHWSYRYAAEAGAALLQDGSCFQIGRVQVRALHVPGHTPEHLTFLVIDTEKAAEPMGALTGDFVFVGDVGRPDLLERAARIEGTMEESAKQLFRSLQKFRNLSDYLQIWPGHGAGSACGKALSAVPQSTLGYEKRFNWAFSLADESEFVEAVLAGQPEPPRYFAEMKRINQTGPRLWGGVRRPPRLPVDHLISLLGDGGVVVDTRSAAAFVRGAVPGTISIPANRSFTTWAGSLLPYDQEVHLIVDEGPVDILDELIRDLAGVGLDQVTGYFGTEVLDAWRRSQGQLQEIPSLTLTEFITRQGEQRQVVLDVRSEEEWTAGHIPESRSVPLGELELRRDTIPRDRTLTVHCQTGSRAAMAAGLLRAWGFGDVRLFFGGFAEWRAAGQPVEQ
jgi:hydroxyacylglutathione hydrolase